jgi:hypothetical protein
VTHQRYLLPFIPISLFGLALAFDSKATKWFKWLIVLRNSYL